MKNIDFIHFDTIDSTNTWVKKNGHTLDPKGISCITALEQTAGRGRFSRKWLSPRGDIYATLFFTVPQGCPYLHNLGQLLAFSCAAVLKAKGFEAEIKWPNDLLISGKKVAGVLCETFSLNERTGIALGIGINVNMSDDLLKTIDQPATSLAQLSVQTWNLEQILTPLLEQFLKDLEQLQKHGFAPFQSSFQNLLAFKGKEISCHDGMKIIKGTCKGISKEGKLELSLPTGKSAFLTAGEVKSAEQNSN
jgi:BirA family biotin operon repressor/biotin-[acetyl-CoA-carboxylase] ligase